MNRSLPKVCVTRRLPKAVEDRMQELFDTKLSAKDNQLSGDALKALMQDCEILVPTVTDSIDADLIAQAGPDLKLIANYGNGVDNIDVEAAAKKGITVTNTPNVLNEDTADMTMGLIIAVTRRFLEGAKTLETKGWAGWSPTWMLGHRISGKKLGIIGMGRVGTAVARRAKAFGMSINYNNRNQIDDETEQELEATYFAKLDDMLREVDIVSINCPFTPETYHLLSKERIALLKPESVLINAARGDIVDEAALVEALKSNKLAGAGLDVFESEPSKDAEIKSLVETGRLVMLPHMSSATIEGRVEMGERVIINIRTHVDGHKPPDRVLPSLK